MVPACTAALYRREPMKLGVMSSLLGAMKLPDALDVCQKLKLEAIELPAGGYPGDPWKLSGIHKNKRQLARLRGQISDHGLEVMGIAVHGNPVHPNKRLAQAHRKAFRNAVALAAEFNTVVVAFSGCPGGSPADRAPNWVTCPWPTDFSQIVKYQWDEVLIPYWRSENDFAAKMGVRIALEMHPGFCVYNPETVVKLRKAAGKQVGANLEQFKLACSHFR